MSYFRLHNWTPSWQSEIESVFKSLARFQIIKITGKYLEATLEPVYKNRISGVHGTHWHLHLIASFQACSYNKNTIFYYLILLSNFIRKMNMVSDLDGQCMRLVDEFHFRWFKNSVINLLNWKSFGNDLRWIFF